MHIYEIHSSMDSYMYMYMYIHMCMKLHMHTHAHSRNVKYINMYLFEVTKQQLSVYDRVCIVSTCTICTCTCTFVIILLCTFCVT